MASSHTESTLIAKLESSTSIPIFSLFSDFLLPFTHLTNSKKPKSQSQTLIRSLAKQFLPFINRSLSILPKRLSDPSKLPCDGKATPKLALELFDTYRLCLDCLELVSSQLSCKPYAVYVQRVRLVYCLEAWGLYREAESEGFGVLEKVRGLDFGAKKKKKKKTTLAEFIPDTVEVADAEFARLVVETVVALVKCAALQQNKSVGDYRRVIVLVEEVKPWFRELDANAYDKLHRVLVTYLGKCTMTLVGDPSNFEGNMLHAFCVTTLSEYGNSSLKDQIYKFARRVCSSLFFLQDDRSLPVIDILKCVLDCLACKCKVEGEKGGTEFVELVSYCANKCQTACMMFCSNVAEHFNTLADDLYQAVRPVSWILRLYALGLYFANCVFKSMVDDAALSKASRDEHAVNILLGGRVRLGSLANSLSSLQGYLYVSCLGSWGAKYEESANNLSPASDSHSEDFLICTQGNRMAYLPAYFNVLKFVCQPLAELVNSGKKQILDENDLSSVSSMLCDIQEAFYQFCDIFLLIHSSTFQLEVDGFADNRMVPIVAVAAFILSIITKLKSQKIRHLLKKIIGSGWIQLQGLKYVFASLYNVGILLYRKKQVMEASKSLNLCCRASWVCLIHLCQRFVDKQNEFVGEISEDAILELAAEACARTAFLLDVLYQCDGHKMEKIIVNSLEKWSVAENLFRRLSGPMALVKQWVKIECKLNSNVDVDNDTPPLHSLLSSSVSKRAIGKILQQELLAYEEMYATYPEYCQEMQIKTVDILLQDVYVSKDCFLSKSRILLKKGRVLRSRGFEDINECIQCCSEAVLTIRGEACIQGTPASHQLAVAYCLRAVLTQEAEPNSKQLFQDIKSALKLWLSIPISDYNIPCDESSVLSGDSIMFLLYNVVDLLSMKGYVELHPDIYKLMFRLFKWKNVPAEKCLSILWESRRLNHSLCMSPINDTLIMSLVEEYGDKHKSVEFWINCLKESLPSMVGFLQNFSYLFTRFLGGPYKHETHIQSDVTVDDIKKVASDLISSVPVTSCSVFFAGYLYYDLCERLITTGHLFEALFYAKEAHRLRAKLFQEKFTYSVEQQVEKSTEDVGHNQKLTYSIQNLQMCRSIANEALSLQTISWDFEACYLSPWTVLQCYLESTLQVGTVNEIIGNGAEAETFLLWGKGISCLQSLPLFTVSFSSVLGKLYRKKRSWDLSETELQSAKQTLIDRCTGFACLKCRLVLEVTIDQQLGDLFRSHAFSATGNLLLERVSLAENFYRSALDKLNLSEWKNSVSCPEIVETGAKNAVACSATTLPDAMRGPKETKEARKGRKTKKTVRSLSEEQFGAPENNGRLTCSRYLSSQSQNIKNSADVQNCISKHLKGNNVCGLPDNGGQKKSNLEKKGYENTCICNNMKCWFCLVMEVWESGLVVNFLHMRWEFVRRRLSVRLLNGIGKCLGAQGQVHEMHEIILQSISVLVNRSPLNFTYAPLPVTFLLDLVGEEFSMDVFAIERAAILYNICWFSLKSYHSKVTRNPCCDLYHVQIPKVVSWLTLAFVVSREVPILFQKVLRLSYGILIKGYGPDAQTKCPVALLKFAMDNIQHVSKLLFAIYVLSSSSDIFSLPSVCKVLSQSHWASYFHQASLGTQFNYQFFSNMMGKIKPQHQVDDEGTHLTGSTSKQAETCKLPRLAPESVQGLEQLVIDFFSALPCTTIICISLLGGSYASLLRELLLYPSSVQAWMLVSRLNDKNQPVVMLLPVDALPEERSEFYGENPVAGSFFESNCLDRHWHCPWDFTTVDDLAPAFKLILEENYLSSSILPSEDTKRNRTLWWMRRKKLDCQLGQLLREIEDSWFGPLRYVLLGGWTECKKLDMVLNKLLRNLKSKCKMDVNESFLKIILGARNSELDIEACISHLLWMRKGCLIGKAAHCDKEKRDKLPKEYEGAAKLSGLAIQLLHEAVSELEDEETANREPLVMVLDYEVQMLPWENLPMLRNQEVYRMPSVGSICLALDRTAHCQEQAGRTNIAFPFIDPLDAFYLLNPSGDLSSTQIEFENWFKSQNFEGKAGSAPTVEELASALSSHDLFIYFGHGSGVQYISRQEIQKLEKCAATLLMGCSSGSLLLNGCYIPQGTPLSYLIAGSPAIVANLWEVTDKDIDRFGKSMLDSWLKERSSSSIGCIRCNLVEEFEAMNIRGGKVNAKRKFPKQVSEASDNSNLKDYCDHRPKIGSFMGQAREACTLPFLIGASPVCYGVPTGIKRKGFVA